MNLRSSVCGLLLVPWSALSQSRGIEGNWRNPSGSIMQVFACGDAVCLKIMQIEKTAPGVTDENNPDASLRSRALCGLKIGSDFKPDAGRMKADGGSLYDPKSGKTYTGTITADGDLLRLRGYVGLKVFGRTEEWKRVNEAVSVCRA